jgi:hypothetical protein
MFPRGEGKYRTVPLASGIHRWTQTIGGSLGVSQTIPLASGIHQRTQIIGVSLGGVDNEQFYGRGTVTLAS